MKKINMLSKAHTVKGQGVLSAHDEQVALASGLDGYTVMENKWAKSDVIHCHTIHPEFLLWCFLHPGSVRVGYVHFVPSTLDGSIHLPKLARKLFYRYICYFYRKMDKLVTVNPYFIDVLAEYGIPREKVSYIPNFVSEEQFYPLPCGEKAAAREEYGIAKEKFTVLCVGQLQARKGFFDYIELARLHPEMEFLWAGGFLFGKIMDGYDRIREAIGHLPENMRMLGVVDREKMNRVYNLADLFLLPSYEELFPMAILEAMSCQLPVLVRDLPIYDDILFDYCMRADGLESFHETIGKLAGDVRFYDHWKKQALLGHKYYSRERIRLLWKYFYDSICLEREQTRGENAFQRKEGGIWRQEERKSFVRH